jgi:hypothetical protein
MVRISIFAGKENVEDMAEMLRHIADQLDQGMTSGYYPGWELVEEEE